MRDLWTFVCVIWLIALAGTHYRISRSASGKWCHLQVRRINGGNPAETAASRPLIPTSTFRVGDNLHITHLASSLHTGLVASSLQAGLACDSVSFQLHQNQSLNAYRIRARLKKSWREESERSFVFGFQQESLREEESMPALRMKDPSPSNTAAEAKLEQLRPRAYELYEARNRENGNDLEDWFQAETDITGNTQRSASA